MGENDDVIGIMDRPEKVKKQSINEYIISVYSSQGKENKWDLVDKLRIQQFQKEITVWIWIFESEVNGS